MKYPNYANFEVMHWIGGSMAACGLKSDRKGGADFGDNNFELFLDHFHSI
jgi:hypothetical protein